jgi:predicted aspartyl protease
MVGLVLLYGNYDQDVHSKLASTMDTATMDKVLVTARLENLEDIYKAGQGALPAEQVRSVEVTDALIDTGATGLLLPRRLIAQLGLPVLRTRPARTIAGSVEVPIYRAVRLTIQGRDCISDVGEIGHGGVQMIDVLSCR